MSCKVKDRDNFTSLKNPSAITTDHVEQEYTEIYHAICCNNVLHFIFEIEVIFHHVIFHIKLNSILCY